MTKSQAKSTNLGQTPDNHKGCRVARPDEHPGQIGRFGNETRMVIHPTDDDPTAPNTGTIHYPAGTGFPCHSHDFAQVWYMLDGECQLGDRRLRKGDIVYHADPHEEQEMFTKDGCTMLFVQYQGPTTGARPIYDRRFDSAAETANADMNLAR